MHKKRAPIFLVLTLLVCPLFAQRIPQENGGSEISGTWFGKFVVTNPDGSTSHNTAVLVIKRNGSAVTGTVGATIDQQTPITDGDVEKHRIRFHLNAAGGMDFSLRFDNGHLQGEAVGRSMRAKIDVRPAPGLLPIKELTEEIRSADAQVFDAFSNCDEARYGSLLDKNLEFYQDRTGKTDYEENLEALRNRCAEGIKLRRELVEGSLVVNAVPGYGAIEAGTQRFYSRQTDGSEHLDATAQFTCVWSKESGSWKLLRVISFDHH